MTASSPAAPDERTETIRPFLIRERNAVMSVVGGMSAEKQAEYLAPVVAAEAALASLDAELAQKKERYAVVRRAYGIEAQERGRLEVELAQTRQALTEAHARFLMIEDEGEITGDEGRPSLARTIGLMAGIAERGKVEARAVLAGEDTT